MAYAVEVDFAPGDSVWVVTSTFAVLAGTVSSVDIRVFSQVDIDAVTTTQAPPYSTTTTQAPTTTSTTQAPTTTTTSPPIVTTTTSPPTSAPPTTAPPSTTAAPTTTTSAPEEPVIDITQLTRINYVVATSTVGFAATSMTIPADRVFATRVEAVEAASALLQP